MSNDIYKILNNFNKLTEQKPQPTEQKAAAKPKTQLQESIEQVNEKYMGFKKTVAAIKKGGSAENPEAVAASIGRKKYGKEKFQKAAAAGKKLNEMDKSQPSSDRGGESSGDPYAKGGKATPIKPKDMSKHALKVLNKKMNIGRYGDGSTITDRNDPWKGVKEEQQDESALQAYLGKKKYGEKGMKALQQAGREGASKEKMAKIRAQHDKMDESEQVTEKAVSKAQQKFMGMVHSAQKGGKAASPEVAKVAKGMSKKAAKDYASTKHKGLPQHVNETIIKALQEGYTKEQIVQYILENADKEYWKDLMKDVPDKGAVSKTVHKGHYGTEYQGDSDDDDDDGKKKIAKPTGEKRGRGRPKGVKNRVVRAGEKKAAPTGEKRGRGRPAGSKNKMKEAWESEHEQMISEAYTKIVEKELGQIYRADRMPNIPAPVPTDPTWIKDPKTGEYKPDIPKPAPAPKPAPTKGTEKRSDIEGDMAVAEMMRLAGMEGKLHGKQHKLDVDKDGEIESDDLADLRAGKKVDSDGMKEEGVAGEAGYTSQMDKASDEMVKQWKNDNEPEVALGAKGSGWGDTPAQAEPAQRNYYTPPGTTDRTKTMQKPNQYHRFTMKEFDMEEGNEFSGALDAARDAGKKEFEVDGRTYPVKESQLDECGEMGPMANGMNTEQEGKMNVSTNMSSDGNKSVTVTADGEAAVELMQMLALAGMKQVEQVEVMETAFKAEAKTDNEKKSKDKDQEIKKVKEEKDSRYEANTTPEEELLPLEVQLKGGDGEVAGKEKEMSPHGSARFSDNPLAVKESMTAKLMREYEGIKVKK